MGMDLFQRPLLACSVIESLWKDESYTGEVMLCVGLLPQARREHIALTNIKQVYYYFEDPQPMGNTQKTHGTMLHFTALLKEHEGT